MHIPPVGEVPLPDFSDAHVKAPTETQRIFGAFQQADSSTTRRFGGTGLGLQLSKRLAQMLGGDITVQSSFGQGSVFSLTIDAQAAGASVRPTFSAPPRASTQAPARALELQGVRVLLAEDGPDNQRLIAFFLDRAGADVQIAVHGNARQTPRVSWSFVLLDPAETASMRRPDEEPELPL